MRKFLLLLFLFATTWSYGQTSLPVDSVWTNEPIVLKGRVLDALTNEPIKEVAVYLDGTSFGTTTDAEGRFILQIKEVIYTPLIFSHLAYQTCIVRNPYDDLPVSTYLVNKEIELDVVTVVGDKKKNPFSREEMMKSFRDAFLGESAKKQKCVILNEDAIQVSYDVENRTLHAEADRPLQIQNPYLGYEITFDLAEFAIYFSHTYARFVANSQNIHLENSGLTLNKEAILSTLIKGAANFADIAVGNQVMEQRRKDVYERSIRHFLLSLTHNRLAENNFTLRSIDDHELEYLKDWGSFLEYVNRKGSVKGTDRGLSVVEPGNVFLVSDNMIRLNPTLSRQSLNDETVIYGIIKIQQRFKKQKKSETFYTKSLNNDSLISFFTDRFLVDAYGNAYPSDLFFLSGEYGRRRIADLLPLDYLPEEYIRSEF